MLGPAGAGNDDEEGSGSDKHGSASSSSGGADAADATASSSEAKQGTDLEATTGGIGEEGAGEADGSEEIPRDYCLIKPAMRWLMHTRGVSLPLEPSMLLRDVCCLPMEAEGNA